MDANLTVGLFGTCGNSTWRQRFMQEYEAKGISFFNPQKADWKPEDADEEAQHLVSDGIILFPVTGETYGCGSLAETGFSIMQAIRSDANRFVVIWIEKEIHPILQNDEAAFKESKRARALTLAHLKKANHPNVFLVSSLDEMLQVSLRLHQALINLQEARGLCTTHWGLSNLNRTPH